MGFLTSGGADSGVNDEGVTMKIHVTYRLNRFLITLAVASLLTACAHQPIQKLEGISQKSMEPISDEEREAMEYDLRRAAYSGDLAMVRQCLEAGIDPDTGSIS